MPKLTPTEREVLCWIAEGKRCTEIAQFKDRSPKTIETHMSNVRYKLDACTMAQAVAVAMRLEIIE